MIESNIYLEMILHTNLDLTLLGWILGAVLGISAVSATFSQIFLDVYNIPKEIDIEFLRYPISRTLTIRNPLS